MQRVATQSCRTPYYRGAMHYAPTTRASYSLPTLLAYRASSPRYSTTTTPTTINKEKEEPINVATTPGRCPMGHDSPSPSSPSSPSPSLSATSPIEPIAQTKEEGGELKAFSDLPGPKGWPLLGVLPEFVRNMASRHDLFTKWHKEHGSIIRIPIPGEKHIHLFDPKDIEEVFRLAGTYPHRQALDPWVMYRKEKGLPLGVVLSQGEEWKKFRTVLNKLLQPAITDTHVPRVWDVAEKYTHAIGQSLDKNGVSKNFQTLTLHFGLEAIIAILLGRKLGLFSADKAMIGENDPRTKLIKAVNGMFSTSDKLAFGFPFYKLWKTPLLKEHYDHWDNMFSQTEIIENEKTTDDDESKYNDGVLSLVDHVRDSGADKLTPTEVNVTCSELISAGVDTTANATGFAFYNLAKHPEVQQKLFEEIESVLGKDKPMTAAAWRKMPYLRNTFTEVMRINPVVDANARFFDHEVVVGGYKIPANTNIGMSVWVASRSEANYSDPEKFDPDRHSREGGKDYNAYASIPFGHGARMCVGRRLATMEIHMAMASIVRHYKMEYTGDVGIISTLLLKPTWQGDIKFIPRV